MNVCQNLLKGWHIKIVLIPNLIADCEKQGNLCGGLCTLRYRGLGLDMIFVENIHKMALNKNDKNLVN